MTFRAKPSSCRDCACHSHGSDFSQIEGTGSSGVMYVGEASGEHEQRDQLPFRPYAPAGGVLERTLRRMAIDRQSLSVTNVLRCRPRNNWLEGAPWEFAAANHCRSNLDRAIADRRPRVIVALGGTALRSLTGMAGEAQGISHLAGYVLPGPNEIPVIGNFHPSFLRHGKMAYAGLFARILQRAVNIAKGQDQRWIWRVDPADSSTWGGLSYHIHPTIDEATGYYLRLSGQPNKVIVYDLETFESASLDEDAREGYQDTDIRLIQFCSEEGEAWAFPWDGRYKAVAHAILNLPNVKAAHNGWLFDNKVLRAVGEREGIHLVPQGMNHDTLQMLHHWQPDLPAHLQFAAQYVSFPFPWKHLSGTNLEFYGCCDVDATLRLYNMLERTLRRDGLWDDGVAA